MTHRTDQKAPHPPLIGAAYRLALAARFAGMACVLLVLFGLLVFLALNKQLGAGYVTDLATLSGLEERLPALLWGAGLAYMCAAGAAALLLSLLWTHAVSGPLVRVHRSLQLLAGGALVEDLRFRRTDQLHPLAGAFQQIAQATHQRRAKWEPLLARAESLIQECEELAKQRHADPAALKQRTDALQRVYEELADRLRSGASG
jgi:hypothetical protein